VLRQYNRRRIKQVQATTGMVMRQRPVAWHHKNNPHWNSIDQLRDQRASRGDISPHPAPPGSSGHLNSPHFASWGVVWGVGRLPWVLSGSLRSCAACFLRLHTGHATDLPPPPPPHTPAPSSRSQEKRRRCDKYLQQASCGRVCSERPSYHSSQSF
jgi:hypothetical protein